MGGIDDDACARRRWSDDDRKSHEKYAQSGPHAASHPMLWVGLTGGIATGKSTVGIMFIELGCHLIDADRITHELFQPGQPVYESVVQAFGDRILASDGRIDRKILGEIVFSDPQARSKLHALVHPAVIQRQPEQLNGMETKDAGRR